MDLGLRGRPSTFWWGLQGHLLWRLDLLRAD